MDKFEDIRKELEEKELDAEDELELTGRDTEINELITNDTKHVLIKNMKDRYRRNKIRYFILINYLGRKPNIIVIVPLIEVKILLEKRKYLSETDWYLQS